MRKILEERIQQRKEIQQSLFEKLNKAVFFKMLEMLKI